MTPDSLPFGIRRAGPDDAPALAGMRWTFRTEMGSPVEAHDAFVARCTDWMHTALADDGRWRAWLAERDGRAIGHLWLQLIEKIPNPVGEPPWHGYVTNVYVCPDARGAGAGRALLAAAMAHCRECGVHDAILWPSDRSRPLYARAGFAVSEDVLVRRFAGAP